MTESRLCERCGENPGRRDHYQHALDRAASIRYSIEVENAQLRARVKELEYDLTMLPRGYQAKISRQGKAIRRLEQKLVKASVEPYAGVEHGTNEIMAVSPVPRDILDAGAP